MRMVDGTKGDLYIKFNIHFPEFLNLENKEKLQKILN